jgi:rubredoxin
MKCKLCGEVFDDETGSLETHLWNKHDMEYRRKWSKLVHSFYSTTVVKVE